MKFQMAYTVSSCLRLNENFCSPHVSVKEVNENKTTVETETDTLSPVLFDDSPNSFPTAPGTDGKVEVFGTSAEEAVREMRFRIEQKTALTASAGNIKNCCILFIHSGHKIHTVLMDFVLLSL